MARNRSNRRQFLKSATATGPIVTSLPWSERPMVQSGGKPAAIGGAPVRTRPFPSWPVTDQTEDKALLDVLHHGKWFRGDGKVVDQFEQEYARVMGVKRCLATANGTSALITSLAGLGVGPGDEVIIPPYTFIATLNAVLIRYALPVFVDSDAETFQIDSRKIEAAITDRTAVIMPVHIGGSAADLKSILEIGKRRRLPVVEDACQAHYGEWEGHKLGSLGTTGCFSFQASKNLNSGEGGAILTNDEALAEKCFAFHNNCRPRRSSGYNFQYMGYSGANLRMTEFQAGLLLAQMTRVERQSQTRNQNALYLTGLLEKIPGVKPARLYPGCTRSAWHLYMFRYDREKFAGLSRSQFLKALRAEGIPASGGYEPLNKEALLKDALGSKAFRSIYPEQRLTQWGEQNRCPENDKLCQQAVWLTQTMLLGDKNDMEQIAEAVSKISRHAGDLLKLGE